MKKMISVEKLAEFDVTLLCTIGANFLRESFPMNGVTLSWLVFVIRIIAYYARTSDTN